MKTISMVSSEVWKEVFIDVNKAVVFIDNACAEVLHWNGGLSALTEAGAVDVKEFSSFEVNMIEYLIIIINNYTFISHKTRVIEYMIIIINDYTLISHKTTVIEYMIIIIFKMIIH